LDYDPQKGRKGGTKYVRHSNISPENVVSYDVHVFTVPRPDGEGNYVCVNSESLAALAALSWRGFMVMAAGRGGLRNTTWAAQPP